MKAQSATEYLLSYSWAILALAALLVVLLMIGLPNLASSEPERCSFPVGSTGCESIRLDNGATGNTLRIRDLNVSNNFNKKIYVCGIVCTAGTLSSSFSACGQTGSGNQKPAITPGNSTKVIINGQMQSITGPIPCTDEQSQPSVLPVNSLYRGKLYIFYSYAGETTGNAHTSTGELVARVGKA